MQLSYELQALFALIQSQVLLKNYGILDGDTYRQVRLNTTFSASVRPSKLWAVL